MDGSLEFEESSGSRRWSEGMTYAFRAPDDKKLWRVGCDKGLTEYQHDEWEDTFEKDGTKMIRATEVEIYEEMVPVKKIRAV